MEPVTLVDAENVRRSQWPNVGREELVELVRAWAESGGRRAIVVYDGSAPAADDGERLQLVGTGRESADDAIAREAERLAHEGTPYRLVTSDRGLRARAGSQAEDVVGGGTFVRALAALRTAGTDPFGVGPSDFTSGPSGPSSPAGRAGRA